MCAACHFRARPMIQIRAQRVAMVTSDFGLVHLTPFSVPTAVGGFSLEQSSASERNLRGRTGEQQQRYQLLSCGTKNRTN
mmetsp:Transcript_25892/g.74878  ORF Transcript_25892/g.74878 Transcript_25892/m.74878 type:complete len:80 (-) Transcript_25892:125-364(-)